MKDKGVPSRGHCGTRVETRAGPRIQSGRREVGLRLCSLPIHVLGRDFLPVCQPGLSLQTNRCLEMGSNEPTPCWTRSQAFTQAGPSAQSTLFSPFPLPLLLQSLVGRCLCQEAFPDCPLTPGHEQPPLGYPLLRAVTTHAHRTPIPTVSEQLPTAGRPRAHVYIPPTTAWRRPARGLATSPV